MTTNVAEELAAERREDEQLPHLWLFALAFALLLCHELDAMIREEWELFPGLRSLPDDTAADVFNLLHVVLFGVPIWLLVATSVRVRNRTIVAIEVFAIGHAVAHAVFSGLDAYLFEPPVETITVYGSAAASLAHLAVMARSRRKVLLATPGR